MEKLFALHDSYMSQVPMEFTRSLMDHINWNSRLIGIKGPKGVGKSTLMKQYVRKKAALSRMVWGTRYFGTGRLLRAFPQMQHRKYKELLEALKKDAEEGEAMEWTE